jgi:molybdopterin molybdotransferase
MLEGARVPQWIELEEAWSRIEAEVRPLPAEVVPLQEARGRVLAAPVRTDRDYPPFDRAAMDGYAVRSADLERASRASPVQLDVVGEATPGDGFVPDEAPRGAVRIMTGAPVPAGWDSVVPVESTSGFDPRHVHIFASTQPGQNVAARGVERHAGETLCEPGRRLGAVDIGILAMAGAARVAVARRPRVAVLSTGNELVPFDQSPRTSQIRNSNAPMLAALAEPEGDVQLLGRVADSRDETADAVSGGLHSDLLLITGGVSMGVYDWVGAALDQARVQVHFRRVALQPGKPVLIGTHPTGAVLALPGNPVSAYTTFRLFALPALRRLQGAQGVRPRWFRAAARFEWEQRAPKCVLIPGRVRDAGASVERVPYSGSGDLMAYARANCQIVLTRSVTRVRPGDPVQVWPLDAALFRSAGGSRAL